MEKTPQPSSSWVHVTGNPTKPASPPDVAESEPKSPPSKRRKEEKERSRVSRACDRCKKKKTRCTGRCPCTLCLRSGLTCEFTASYTRGRLPSVVVDEAAVVGSTLPPIALPGQVHEASPQISSKRTLPYPRFQPAVSNQPSTDDIFSRHNRLAVPNEDTTRDAASRSSPEPTLCDRQGHFVGPSSGVSFLLRIQKTLHQNTAVSHDTSIFTFGDAPLPEYDPTFFVMPPKADAQRLVERYFDWAAPTHRFLHRPTIEKMLDEFYETQGEMRSKEDSAAKTALLLIVFAQAQAYMPPGSTGPDNSARYFFASEHQLSKERGAVRLTSVQARLGQCFYLLTQSRINHCWSLFGTTAHLAYAIGLNRSRRSDASGTVDYIELENRRRLFWCAYTLDKFLAAALGRPMTFKDEDIDQELPSVVNDVDLHSTYMNPSPSRAQSTMMAPVEHMKLSRIVSQVLRDLYPIRPPSMALRIELAAKYTRDLRGWRVNLSRFLDGDGVDSSLLIPLYQRQRNVLNLAYYQATLLVHRPFLLSNFATLTHIEPRPGNPSTHSNIDTSHHIAACLEAALSIVRLVDELFQGNQIFRAFWFTQYYAFCAVVVLYIYRIQQHLVEPGRCEGYFAAGQKCQAQLESISESDCLSKRYCLVLEELRLEAEKHTQHRLSHSASPSTIDPTLPAISPSGLGGIGASSSTPQSDTSAFREFAYGGNVPPTPESAVFSMMPASTMSDLMSWGQFDSLVTAGIGMLDGGGWQDGVGGFGFGR